MRAVIPISGKGYAKYGTTYSNVLLGGGSGAEPGILNGNAFKPKGMQWRTFERLQGEHTVLTSALP